MTAWLRWSRERLSGTVGGETLRAFLVFSALFVALVGAAGFLAFRDLSRMVVARRMQIGYEEAARIAEAVAALGKDRDRIDFHQVRQQSNLLVPFLRERMSSQPFLTGVEVRDRFGARLAQVGREDLEEGGASPGGTGASPPAFSPEPDQKIVTAQLRPGAQPTGEVRVGVSQTTAEREIDELRGSLRMKIAGAAGFGVAILLLGFLYVLYLLRKNRLLERSRLAAERRSYVGLLASGLAHEIRNPLNAMNMNLQMLEEEMQSLPGAGDADWADLLASTKSEIKRLERLVNNFLAYARPSEPRFESKDLNEVLSEVARFLQADFRRSNVDLRLDPEPLLPNVEIDVTQFKQALMNLLVNARQVLRDGGHVVLRSRASAGGEAVVEVEDDGPGISAEGREKIFEVFYSDRAGGTGLGLPIARQIVERHGGAIEVGAGRERGTVFRIRLPRRHPEPAPLESRGAKG